jgi:hypothetical protein
MAWSEDVNIFARLQLPFKVLKWSGFDLLSKLGTSRREKILHYAKRSYSGVVCANLSLQILLQIIYLLKVDGNVQSSTQTLVVVMTLMEAFIKILKIWSNKQAIVELLRRNSLIKVKQLDSKHLKEITGILRAHKTIVIVKFMMMTAAILAFCLGPVVKCLLQGSLHGSSGYRSTSLIRDTITSCLSG